MTQSVKRSTDQDPNLAWRGTVADILPRRDRAALELQLFKLRAHVVGTPKILRHEYWGPRREDPRRVQCVSTHPVLFAFDDAWHVERGDTRAQRFVVVRAALYIRELLRRDEEGREAQLDGWESLQDCRWPTRVTHRPIACTKCDWTPEAEAAAQAKPRALREAILARWQVCFAPRIYERVLPLWEQKNLREKTP